MVAQKKSIDKTNNVPNLEVLQVVLVQCNSVDNQDQQKSEISHTFTRNNSYAYPLNVELTNITLKLLITFTV